MDFQLFSHFCFTFMFFSNYLVGACDSNELELVQMIFRHGSHTPIDLYPTGNPATSWPEGMGKLTQLGKYQCYALGSYLRAHYSKFITSNPSEVYAQSSSSNLCVNSALSFLASLYAPSPDWEISKDYKWQPIPVKYSPAEDNKYFGIPDCPEIEAELKRNMNSTEAQQFLQQYQVLFDYWSSHSGWKIRNWNTAAILYSTLSIENFHNLTIPQWAWRYWKELREVSDMSYYLDFKSKLIQRLRSGPLIDLVIERMKKKAAGSIPEKKVYLYATHTENIASFLSALNVFNGIEPPSSSTVLLELYNHIGSYYVRFLYMNSSTPEIEPQYPKLLILQGCTEFCPLDYVVDYTIDIIPKEWEKECGLK